MRESGYHNAMNADFDVVIVGGGLVGASLAIALDGSGLRVALVESVAPKANYQPSYDERNLALARASVQALAGLGVWQSIASRGTPIEKIHVSRWGDFGVVRLNATEHGLDDFGAVIPARELGNGLLTRLETCTDLTRICPAQVIDIIPTQQNVQVSVRDEHGEKILRTRLLVGADGADSFVRQSLGIIAEVHDYHQTCFVTTVLPEYSMDGCAYERFTDSGPVALLPLTERRAGLVLTVSSEETEKIAALSDNLFIDFVHDRFGYRLGRISRPGKRVSYPLRRVWSNAVIAHRAVLVGNAAQAIHPIGAQGFNLGLRDALTLAELLCIAAKNGCDPAERELLHRYVARREKDRSGVAEFGHSLVHLMGTKTFLVGFFRSFGMLMVDSILPLKQELALRGMGFHAQGLLSSQGK